MAYDEPMSLQKIHDTDVAALSLVCYPDPRLNEVCTPIGEVDGRVVALAERMLELMFENRGVGLAGPQVGVTARIFVASPSFDPADRLVYIDPVLSERQGEDEDEEGCLSFPGVRCKVKRARKLVIEATGLDGQRFSQEVADLHARICQHEFDHIEGITLNERMSRMGRMANRKALKQLVAEAT